eukprot:CAMPEP_0177690502 /NCGR_PEP_ID=MMETSP0484_2-20121128/800_1 /TAXON_ID=354590 /ORGANISM="Rhodomonas lens, Strain RHODO" /LENGTH=76 /DNA_ID=CAMNT_0019201049 /DNA_START=173 /DNA_END=400 /DNA_ORIENTATION=+
MRGYCRRIEPSRNNVSCRSLSPVVSWLGGMYESAVPDCVWSKLAGAEGTGERHTGQVSPVRSQPWMHLEQKRCPHP